MDTATLRQIRELLDLLAEAPLADIPALLDRHCQSPDVRRHVESALAELHKDETLGGFLDHPALHPDTIRTADDVAGRRIGRYELLRIIGEGGMGTVYEARQENPRRGVALKVLKSGFFTPSALRRFERESAVLGLLHHACIAQIYEAGVEVTPIGRVPFFAMELVQGEPLDVYARTHRPDTNEILSVIAQVCDAVHHAHTHGVIHRDLKPGNIMVVPDARAASGSRHGESAGGSGVHTTGPIPKILDFGVARVINPEVGFGASTQTEDGQIVGTLTYMSPEQVSARFGQVGPRTDVYALGAILYELLAGRPALDVRSRTLPEATNIIAGENPTRLRSIVKRLHEDVETIVAKAMDKDPKRRYASAAELAMDLRRYLHKEPIAARPATTLYQLRRFAARNRALVGGIAATIAALALGLAGTLVFAAKAQEQGALAQRRAEEAERKSYLSDIRAAQAAILSNESALARVSLQSTPEHLRGWEWDHLNWTLTRDSTTLTAPIPGGYVPMTGYDNEMLIVAQDVERVNVDSGKTELLFTRPGRPRAKAAWCTPDGHYLRISLGGTNVELWDLRTRQLVREYTSTPASLRFADDRPVLATPSPGAIATITDALTGELLGSHSNRDLTVTLSGPGTTTARYLLDLPNSRYLPVPASTFEWKFQGASLYISPLGKFATTYAGRRASWDVMHIADGARVGSVDARSDIASHGFSTTRAELAISTAQGTIEVWDLNSLARRVTLSTDGISRAIRFTPDGRWLLAGEQDGRLRRWSADASPSPFTSFISTPLALSPDGSKVVGRYWGPVRCWNTISGELLWTRFLSQGYANCGAFSPDGSLLALGLSGRITILNAATGEVLTKSDDFDTPLLLSACFTPDGQTLFVGCGDGRIVALSAADHWKTPATLPARHTSAIMAVRVSPDGAYLVTTSGDGKPLQDINIPAGSNDNSVRLWNARTHAPIRTIDLRPARVSDVCFSADSAQVYGAGMDGLLTAWSLPDGALLWQRHISDNGLTSISSRGQSFVVGEFLGAVHLIAGAAGADVVLPRAAPGYCHFAQFTPDGKTLLAATAGELTLYETGPPACGFAAREAARRARAVYEKLPADALVEDRLTQARALCAEWGESWEPVEKIVTTDGDTPTQLINTAFLSAMDAAPGAPILPLCIRQARRCTQIMPEYGYYWDTLALALYRAGEFGTAREASDRASEADSPANPSALHQFVRALILHATGDKPAAAACLDRARALMSSPSNAGFSANSVLKFEVERLLATP